MSTPFTIVMLTADRQVDRRILLEAQSLRDAGHLVTIFARAHDDTSYDGEHHIIRTHTGGAAPSTLLHKGYAIYRRFLPLRGALYRMLRVIATTLLPPERIYAHEFLPMLTDQRPDIWMAHDLPMLPVAVAAAQQYGGRVVFDSHELFIDCDISPIERKRWHKLESRLIGQCAAVFTINPSIAAVLADRYTGTRPYVLQNADLLPDPLPSPARYFHTHFGLPENARVALFQGGITAGRNLHTLVNAMTHLRGSDLVLVLMGDGDEHARIQEQIHNLGLQTEVKLHPRIAQSSLLAHTAAADFGLIPYQPYCLNNRLCSPNKLYEFIVAGLPILASDLPEIRRVVIGEDIGMVADLSTPEKAADALRAMLQHPLGHWRERLAEVRRRINWQQESRVLVRAFDSLAA